MANPEYVIASKQKPHNNLWNIAEYYLGDGKKYKQLAAINNIPNPDYIVVGQKIYLKSQSATPASPSTAMKHVEFTRIGFSCGSDNTVLATWDWNRSNTALYQVRWLYGTNDGIAYEGADEEITKKYSTFSPPANAKRVICRVRPIAGWIREETWIGPGTKHLTTKRAWTAEWVQERFELSEKPPATPSAPNVTIDTHTLTARLENLDSGVKTIEFQIVKNDSSVYKSGKATVKTGVASYSCTIAIGNNYKVRCRAINDYGTSAWSPYTSNFGTQPATPKEITVCRATSETSVYLEWTAVTNADTYDIQYATVKEHLDASNMASSVSTTDKTNHFTIGNLDSGAEYFFRVRAKNKDGDSAWSSIKSLAIGSPPAAPTTWSSTTSAVTGEKVTLYWIHNAEDESEQSAVLLEITVNGSTISPTVDPKSNFYVIDTTPYKEGVTIQWKVRTAGVTGEYGGWSVERTIDIYAPVTLELNLTNADGDVLDTITSFPFYVKGVAGPSTQVPIGYHVSIVSNEVYETTDQVGNTTTVNKGEQVYSQYFETFEILIAELSAGNVDLENNISYTVNCVVSMNSGLTKEESVEFTVDWDEVLYAPDAEVVIDTSVFSAHIKPFCNNTSYTRYKVTNTAGTYTVTSEAIGSVFGEAVSGAKTATGEQVYSGTTAEGNEIFYCEVESAVVAEDVLLSVYRREFDGSFTEIASDIVNGANTCVTDPHPSLDYARYRIVAQHKTTGAVSYYDLPGYPVRADSMVIQWDETWSNFEVDDGNVSEQPAWSGSMLKLKANIDVSDSYGTDVSLVEYIGRKRPVTYYGTQLGETSSWSTVIPKEDKETLYALRRLAIWMGDVYVREPSGSGYWANVKVSFSQNHKDLTIPITLDITRVEGGI